VLLAHSLHKGAVDCVRGHGHLGVSGVGAEGAGLVVVAVEAVAEPWRRIGGVAEAGGGYLLAGLDLESALHC